MTPLALGSDTGGSIRQPAACAAWWGSSRPTAACRATACIALASSLDQIGPLTRTVARCCDRARVLAGVDPADATSAPEPVPDYTAA